MLEQSQRERLIHFCQALIDQDKARLIIPAPQPSSGHWFGAGSLVEDKDGTFYLSGRYRNPGDARTGLASGERGFELAIFASPDRGQTFSKVLFFSKADLCVGERQAISIEGSALRLSGDSVELFVSSEKTNIGYPPGLESYLKPGTGVWTIERLQAPAIAELPAASCRTILQSHDPCFVHVKDPFLYERLSGDTVLGFCTHPFTWSGSNSAYTVRPKGSADFAPPALSFFPRGFTWDVAISRITCFTRVPRRGSFADLPPLTLAFYDGGEAMRSFDEHALAVSRPRGYSCEEIGGVAVALEADLGSIERLSIHLPLFVSPHGTGCSRYVSVLQTEEGIYAMWQQSQADRSQPLVMNLLSWADVDSILD